MEAIPRPAGCPTVLRSLGSTCRHMPSLGPQDKGSSMTVPREPPVSTPHGTVLPLIAHRPGGHTSQRWGPLGKGKGRGQQADLCEVRGGRGALRAGLRGKAAFRRGGMGATQERALRGGPAGEGRGVCSQKAQEAMRLGRDSSAGPGTRGPCGAGEGFEGR